MAENKFSQFETGGNRFKQFAAPAISPETAARRDELLRKRAELDAELELTTLGGTAGSIGRALDDNVRLAANGISMGFLDKGLDAMRQPTITDLITGAPMIERAKTNAARDRQGLVGAGSEIAGSFAPMAAATGIVNAASKVPGMFQAVANMAAKVPGLPTTARLAAPTASGAAWGGATALGNDKPIGEGMAWGAGLGMLGDLGARAGSAIINPIASYFRPEKAANKAIIKAMLEAKTNPAQIADDLARAADDGQGVYAVADAMGLPGQRLASTVARNPSEGRAPFVEFLDKRQSGQGRRISNALSEGFGEPATALQRIDALKAARKAGGDVNYTAAREKASAIDTSSLVSKIDEMTGGNWSATDDSVAGVLNRVRTMLAGPKNPAKGKEAMSADYVDEAAGKFFDFPALLRARSDVSDMAQSAFQSGKGKQGAALKSVLSEMDNALAEASPSYRNALVQYAKDSKVIDAVDVGRAASARGRFEDTIPAFQKLSPDEQQAFRAGYSDPLIAQTQSAAVGVNKARPLINDAAEAEFPAFAAPGKAPQLGARIRREQTMFETRGAATGGSKTADNLMDDSALNLIDPSVIGNILTGNFGSAVRSALSQVTSGMKGQNAGTREKLAKILMQTNPVAAKAILESGAKKIESSEKLRKFLLNAIVSGGSNVAVTRQ